MGVLVVNPEQTQAGGAVFVRLAPAGVNLPCGSELAREGASPSTPIQAKYSGCSFQALDWEFPKKISMLRPTFATAQPCGPARTDRAEDFPAKSHSRTQDPDVRFEG